MNINQSQIKKEVRNRVAGFLSKGEGGFFSLGNIGTQYTGWFHFLQEEWELYKTIESISFNKELDNINVKENSFDLNSENESAEFFLEDNNNLFCNISGYKGYLNLDFDFRRIHDYDDAGRIYTVIPDKKSNTTTIKYDKYADFSLSSIKETFFLKITGLLLEEQGEWIKKEYASDAKRNIRNEFYVYRVKGKIDSLKDKQKILFTFYSKNKQVDKKTNKKIKNKILKNKKDNSSLKKFTGSFFEITAEHAINNLFITTKNNGKEQHAIFAGLPWFYQVWSRDELISMTGLLEQKRYTESKEIIMRHFKNILSDGFLMNRWPRSDLGSADGIGWLFKRTLDLITLLEEKEQIEDYFSKDELKEILKKTERSIDTITQTKMKNGLITNNALETWMDTFDDKSNDGRAGARIEIQALHLAGLELAINLSKFLETSYDKYHAQKNKILGIIHEKLIVNNVLLDGLYSDGSQDMTIRPNVFLAYYIFPELLPLRLWRTTFDKILEECWLSWGGVSSISKNHEWFQPRHTGINNNSYHRGDSWYFINNIVGISLLRVDKEKYQEKIEKILEASTNEMLFSGFLGQCAEISSAVEQTSEGCLAQAWSAGTLLEFLNEVTKHSNK